MSDTPKPWRRVAAHGGLAVLLIRHAQSTYNADKRFCGGRSDPPLDAEGREQVVALGRRFAGQVERVYASPQQRALATAAVLAPGAAPTIVEELRELDQGALEGQVIDAALFEAHAAFFRAWKVDPSEVAIPGGGESMGAVAERVGRAMDRVVADHQAHARTEREGRVVAVVGHQMAQAAFVCRALGKPLRHWSEFELRNATANLLVWDGRGWSLMGRNL
jgi:broad specificity phosphatase PhoE